MRGCLVTGTDTGVGKTVLAAAIVAALRASGVDVAAFKPAVTGLDEDPGEWPRDHDLLAQVSSSTPDRVTPHLFAAAVAPHLAARLEGVSLDPSALVAAARTAGEAAQALVVEGVGGLLVPLTATYSVRDFARDLGLPLVVAARPALGTINHTLLTLEAARAAGLDVRAVVLTPWGPDPGELELSNRETIGRLGEVEVATLGRIEAPTTERLAAAGETLSYEAWLSA